MHVFLTYLWQIWIHSVPDIWSMLGPPKNWPYSQNSGQTLDIWSILVYLGTLGPPKNLPNIRKDHISDDHITGNEWTSTSSLSLRENEISEKNHTFINEWAKYGFYNSLKKWRAWSSKSLKAQSLARSGSDHEK